jgi:chromosome segregation ATPase
MRSHPLLPTLLLATLIAFPAAAAKDKTKGLPPARGNNIPEVSEKPMKDAKLRLGQSQGRLERAQDALAKVIGDLRKQAETAPELSESQAAIKQAQSDYEAATAPILEKVRSTSAYQKALDDKKKAAQRVQDLQAESSDNQDQITQAARIVLDKGRAVTQLETAAVAADPKAADLKARLAAANARLLKQRHDLDESIKVNPQVVEARKEVEAAQSELPPVQAAYNSELEKYNTAVAAREKALNDSSNNNRPASTGTGGGPGKRMKKKI